jgi:hypothetical protein
MQVLQISDLCKPSYCSSFQIRSFTYFNPGSNGSVRTSKLSGRYIVYKQTTTTSLTSHQRRSRPHGPLGPIRRRQRRQLLRLRLSRRPNRGRYRRPIRHSQPAQLTEYNRFHNPGEATRLRRLGCRGRTCLHATSSE